MEISDHGTAIPAGEELSRQDLEHVWSRRAALIARAIEQDEKGEQIELVVIRLGREVYGLEVQYVLDIRPLEHITRIPRVPDWVAGIVNLRGNVISVLDLHRLLNLPATERNGNNDPAKTYLVEVEIPEMLLALLVDEVLAVEVVPVSKIQEANNAIRNIPSEYVRGIVIRNGDNLDGNIPCHENRDGNPDNSILVLLDLPALLSQKRLVIHDEVV